MCWLKSPLKFVNFSTSCARKRTGIFVNILYNYIVIYNTTHNSSDKLPSYLRDSCHADVVYPTGRKGREDLTS